MINKKTKKERKKKISKSAIFITTQPITSLPINIISKLMQVKAQKLSQIDAIKRVIVYSI